LTYLRTALYLLSASLVIAFLIAISVSLSPIRWDIKSFSPTLPQLEGPGIPAGSDILFVTSNNDWENGHYARYGLDLITFPRAHSEWVVFREGEREGPWPADWSLDNAGRFYQVATGNSPYDASGAPPDLETIAKSGWVLLRTPETRALLLERWPSLRESKIAVMKPALASFIEFPSRRISAGQFFRTLGFAFTACVVFAFFLGLGRDRGPRWFRAALACPVALAAHTLFVFFLGKLTSAPIPTAFSVELLVAVGLALYIERQHWFPAPPIALMKSWAREQGTGQIVLPAVLLGAGFLTFLLFSVLRLDFDGDMFTQYLPAARYHYLMGGHEPDVLLSRYGLMTQATYPPGFPIVISTMMWVGGMAKDAPLAFDFETNLAVFLYRLVVTILHVSFLAAAAGLFRALQTKQDRFGWLFPVVAVSLLLPLFLGQPAASEVYFVPMVGFSILALLAGDELRQPAYAHLGLFTGGFALFLKKEGLFIFFLILLPWYLIGRLRSAKVSLRITAVDMVCLLLGLAPFLLWKTDLRRLGINEYFFYDRVSLTRLMHSGALLGQIVEKAFRTLLTDNYWAVLFLLLPLAMLFDLVRRQRWRRLLTPAGILAYTAAMTCVFVFSKAPGGPLAQMDVSYERVVFVPVLAAVLHGARVLFCSKARVSALSEQGLRHALQKDRAFIRAGG
jgi:hypothetical protein